MLNKNGKLFFRAYPLTTNFTFKLIDGTTREQGVQNVDYYGMIVGNGTTDATADDYALESAVSGLTKLSDTVTYGQSYDSNFIANYTATFKNDTASDITISEIGVTYYNNYTYDPNDFLIAREVISPVTIPAGKTYSFNMTIG